MSRCNFNVKTRLASLDIAGDQLRTPSLTPRYHSAVIYGGFYGGIGLAPHDAERRDIYKSDR